MKRKIPVSMVRLTCSLRCMRTLPRDVSSYTCAHSFIPYSVYLCRLFEDSISSKQCSVGYRICVRTTKTTTKIFDYIAVPTTTYTIKPITVNTRFCCLFVFSLAQCMKVCVSMSVGLYIILVFVKQLFKLIIFFSSYNRIA